MKTHIKELWLTALNSGEYKQGRNTLKDKLNRFCCLGVLCDLYIKETGDGEWDTLPTQYGSTDLILKGLEGAGSMPPPRVLKWADISEDAVWDTYTQVDFPKTLMGHNDGGLNFTAISTIIQDNF